MSLRVLLADESASIRKVFQMGLQDFGAEVKSVHNGLDVLEVALSYKPHIIFADILLQKKNGYEVCLEVKQSDELSQTPVVLMWSSFMELDQSKYKESGAQGELEKPFDVEKMRNLITSLVEAAQSQKISEFLEFPKSITKDFVEEEKNKEMQDSVKIEGSTENEEAEDTRSIVSHKEAETSVFSLDDAALGDADLALEQEDAENESDDEVSSTSFFNNPSDDVDSDLSFDMYEVTTNNNPSAKEPEMQASNDDEWEAKPLQDSALATTSADDGDGDMDQFQSMDLGNEKKINLDDFLYKPNSPTKNSAATAPELTKTLMTDAGPAPHKAAPDFETISPEETEHIIRSETRKILKTIIADQLPLIMEKVIREELDKVLQQEINLKSANRPSPND